MEPSHSVMSIYMLIATKLWMSPMLKITQCRHDCYYSHTASCKRFPSLFVWRLLIGDYLSSVECFCYQLFHILKSLNQQRCLIHTIILYVYSVYHIWPNVNYILYTRVATQMLLLSKKTIEATVQSVEHLKTLNCTWYDVCVLHGRGLVYPKHE